jgi:hypothetical protein
VAAYHVLLGHPDPLAGQAVGGILVLGLLLTVAAGVARLGRPAMALVAVLVLCSTPVFVANAFA